MNESREGAVLSAETNVQDVSESTKSGGTLSGRCEGPGWEAALFRGIREALSGGAAFELRRKEWHFILSL